ncbi:hypothetical protein M1466_01160 [Candidatus Dependentiae bacterium]|nr:hypothetical protein [Candidatus Dependentiae bacterium]
MMKKSLLLGLALIVSGVTTASAIDVAGLTAKFNQYVDKAAATLKAGAQQLAAQTTQQFQTTKQDFATARQEWKEDAQQLGQRLAAQAKITGQQLQTTAATAKQKTETILGSKL